MAKYTDSEQVFLKTIGNAMRALRNVRGFSQKNLGLKCDMKGAYIGQIERGVRNVCMVNLVKISNALGVHVSVLFTDPLFTDKWQEQKKSDGIAHENKTV